MKKYILLGLVLVLAACVNSSVDSLTSSSKERIITVNSSMPYEQSFNIVSSNFKTCGSRSDGLARYVVTATLDKKTKQGRITQNRESSLFGSNYLNVIDVKAAANGSVIEIYTSPNPLNPDLDKWVKRWLAGERDCWAF